MCAASVHCLPINSHAIERVSFTNDHGATESIQTEVVVSTIPIEALHRLVPASASVSEPPPFDLRWRGLRLLHVISRDRFTRDHETYYFPEPDIIFGRVSELRRYSPAVNQSDRLTALTVEIPCSPGEPLWFADDGPLSENCILKLRSLGVLRPSATAVVHVCSQRFPTVYPMYDLAIASPLHCNINQCMLMALPLAKHLEQRPDNTATWTAELARLRAYRIRE